MNVRMDFAADPLWIEKRRKSDLSGVTRVQLQTSILPGDQIMFVAGVDFSLIGYGIALLEYATGLLQAVARAASPAGYGDTHPLDLDEYIRFCRHGDVLGVDADFTEGVALCSASELVLAMRENCIAVLRFFLQIHPEAAESTELRKWFDVKDLGADELFATARRSRRRQVDS